MSLTVLPEGGKVRKSRASRWRVGVLIGVHLLFGLHLLHWWWSGKDDGVRETLSPVEPSEAMYFIQNGQLNLGTLFLAVTLLSTLLLGRWFCGWGCHVVALQDLCAWMMKKVGIHPKPFRTRLVLWGTLVMAFYMFLWPAAHRWILTPWLGEKIPLYFGASAPWPGLENHIHVEDLWATFASIPVAIPFLFVCGFVVVYFLGAKGYCTYGCPYGALFTPADRFAPARIIVNDNCEHCGHCTAVCTSNVRVHEEVRDFGMVVDPGCMKCMDCVSVCPNEALSFGLAKPSLLAKPRTTGAAVQRDAHPRGSPRYDLSLGTELLLFAIWVAVLWGIRGTLDWVPLLFASGLAAIATYGVAKTWAIFREPHVRAQNVQLKLKGRVKPAGILLILLTAGLLATSGWSAYVRMYLRDTAAIDHVRMMTAINTNGKNLLDPTYQPTPEISALATAVRDKITRSDAPARNGIGWTIAPIDLARLAQAQLALKVAAAAEASYIELLVRERPQNLQIASELIQIMMARQAAPAEVHAVLDRVIAQHPEPSAAHLAKATLLAYENKQPEALASIRAAFTSGVATDPRVQTEAARLLYLSGEPAEAMKRLDDAIAARPRERFLPIAKANLLTASGDGAAAERTLRDALKANPHNPQATQLLAHIIAAGGRPAEASKLSASLNDKPTGELALKISLAIVAGIMFLPVLTAVAGGIRRLLKPKPAAV